MNKNLMAAMQYAKQNQKSQTQKTGNNTPANPTDNTKNPTTNNTKSTSTDSTQATSNAQTIKPTAETPKSGQPTNPTVDSPTVGNQATDNSKNESPKTIITPHADTLMANKTQKTNPPVFKKVDISIIGMPYRIDCPAEEVANLTNTANAINDDLKELRRNIRGKLPSNEELLVLYCLELYDDLQNAKKELNKWQEQQNTHGEFVDKLIKELQ